MIELFYIALKILCESFKSLGLTVFECELKQVLQSILHIKPARSVYKESKLIAEKVEIEVDLTSNTISYFNYFRKILSRFSY